MRMAWALAGLLVPVVLAGAAVGGYFYGISTRKSDAEVAQLLAAQKRADRASTKKALTAQRADLEKAAKKRAIKARDEGYRIGAQTGFNNGYGSGRSAGYGSGKAEGTKEGREQGEAEGYVDGAVEGYLGGSIDGYLEGYDQGSAGESYDEANDSDYEDPGY